MINGQELLVSAADVRRWSAGLRFSVCTERSRNRRAEERKQDGRASR
jgi:hypothetical protein